jgi:hypothetical protein
MNKQNIGNLFAATLIGKQFRFQDCCKRSDEVVYTIESVQFGGYDTDIDESDPGVEIRVFCKPRNPDQPNNIPVFCFGLEDDIEFVETLTVQERNEFQRRHGE